MKLSISFQFTKKGMDLTPKNFKLSFFFLILTYIILLFVLEVMQLLISLNTVIFLATSWILMDYLKDFSAGSIPICTVTATDSTSAALLEFFCMSKSIRILHITQHFTKAREQTHKSWVIT